MAKKNSNLDMRQALRITGLRDAPDLPKIERDDFALGIWRAVHKPNWNLSEAAHYLHEFTPGAHLSPGDAEKVERTKFWLQEKFVLAPEDDDEFIKQFKKTPGDYMRFLWEANRPFSLRVWALYYLVDIGEINFRIEAHILCKRYQKAAEIVWKEFKDASVEEVAEFLRMLPYKAVGADGLPMFASRSIETLKDYIKKNSKLERGHRTLDLRDAIAERSQYLVALIEKELG